MSPAEPPPHFHANPCPICVAAQVHGQPATRAGRELLANLEARFANLPWDQVSYELTREDILAIEAEARALRVSDTTPPQAQKDESR